MSKHKKMQVLKPKFRVDEVLSEIRSCLEIGWTGLGFKTTEFESEWQKYSGFRNAYFVNSATSGLHLAVHILNKCNQWSDDSEVISTPFTFVSTNHVICYENLKIVFADIDDTLTLDPKSVEEKITDKTKAVMFVGLGGNIGNYFEIVELCKKYKLKLILDAAHMAGTKLTSGEIPGKEADVVIYSFQAVKNLGTADAGLVCFSSDKHDSLARQLGWLGIDKDTFSRAKQAGDYKWKYDVPNIGFKYHGNSVMASMALVGLRYLDRDNEYRRQLASRYREKLQPLLESQKLKFVNIAENCQSSTHLFQILVENRDRVLAQLNENDVFPGVHYITNTQYKPYQFAKDDCPTSQYYSDRVLSLPLNLEMELSDIDTVCKALSVILNSNITEKV